MSPSMGSEGVPNQGWMIDCDGVVADIMGAFVEAVNDRFGVRYRFEEIDGWDWWSTQPAKFNQYIWKECFPDTDWMLANVRPHEGAMEAIADLMSEPEVTELRIVSKRPAFHLPMLQRWFAQELPMVDMSGRIICTGRDHKAHFCKLHNLNIVVEDAPHTLLDTRMRSHGERHYMVNRPWNENEVVAHAIRVPELKDVIAYEFPNSSLS